MTGLHRLILAPLLCSGRVSPRAQRGPKGPGAER